MFKNWRAIIAVSLVMGNVACSAAVPASRTTKILVPLSAKEIEVGIEAGLGCDFRIGDKSFLIVTVGEAIVKTDGVVRHFRLDDDRALAIINYGGTLGDESFRILLDRDDSPIATGEEGTVKAARLTVRHAGVEQTLNGKWTCGA